MATKQFHLGDVLSITTGRLLSPEGIGGVYKILNFMTGDNLYTHQLGRVAEECKPFLLKQFPALASIDATEITRENASEWRDRQVAIHGDQFSVDTLPPDAHHVIDPLSELAEKVHPDRIVVLGPLSKGDQA